MKHLLTLASLSLVCLLLGCPPDPCVGGEDPQITLGHGVGGAFEPLEDDQEVALVAAPQGGFGVSSNVLSSGLVTGSVAVRLETRYEDAEAGLHEQNSNMSCSSALQGGFVQDLVTGFDRSLYPSVDDLINFDGETVELVVTVTDADGNEAEVVKPVVIRFGG